MQEVKAKKPAAGVARHESIAEPQGTVVRRELTVRGKKPKTVERTGKGDGSTVLVINPIGLTLVWMLTGLSDKQRCLHCQQASCFTRSTAIHDYRYGYLRILDKGLTDPLMYR
jgi:hypothetical protein